MSWTKRQLVLQAFRKAGLSAFVFNLTPDQLQSAARDMDAMVLDWQTKNILLSYPVSVNPDNVDLDAETNVPPHAALAVYYGLAVLIAPDFGKTPALETKTAANNAFNSLLIDAARPKEIPHDGTMPSGAGNKQASTFIPASDTRPLTVGDNGQLIFGA